MRQIAFNLYLDAGSVVREQAGSARPPAASAVSSPAVTHQYMHAAKELLAESTASGPKFIYDWSQMPQKLLCVLQAPSSKGIIATAKELLAESTRAAGRTDPSRRGTSQ